MKPTPGEGSCAEPYNPCNLNTMSKEQGAMEIDLMKLEPRHAHDLLTSAIIPRPIAWVSSINKVGQTNLAPFSFFSGVSWSPPILAFSVVNRADGSMKDTARNIQEVPEFVVHMVSTDLLSTMEYSAKPIPYGTDESSIMGIHWLPSKTVGPRRIQEAKIAFECSLERVVTVSEGPNAGNLILGRIHLVHVRDDVLKNEREVDWLGLDALGRLSGNRYCSVRSVIESKTN
jgi:flavin reductase (DIM6/NTAB) family NADH-FMN oxidoreductase RutF